MRHRANLRTMRQHVQSREAFSNSGGTCYGEWNQYGDYVVYSYGPHWPLYIYRAGTWFANEDKYSVTTTRHASAAHPHAVRVLNLPCEDMRHLAQGRDVVEAILRGALERDSKPAYTSLPDHIADALGGNPNINDLYEARVA